MEETVTEEQLEPKPVQFLGSSRDDLRGFPKPVTRAFGLALFDAQVGEKNPHTKPLKGFGGAGVLEVVEQQRGSTYRAVYTVKFAGVVYVLHVFQKKSNSGRKTPLPDMQTIRSRHKDAENDYAKRFQD